MTIEEKKETEEILIEIEKMSPDDRRNILFLIKGMNIGRDVNGEDDRK